MNKIASTIGIVALGVLVWGVGVTTNAKSGPAGGQTPASIKVLGAADVAAPSRDIQADQRARLNARIGAMLASGEGARLREPDVRPASQQRRAVAATRAARPAPDLRTASVAAPRIDLSSSAVMPTSEMECLTQALYYEARNESEEGQAAVAEVVLNRARSGRYPRGICDVVYQRNSRTCQFTFTCDGAIGRRPINPVAWRRSETIARSVYNGGTPAILPASSVNYHANYVSPSWGRRLQRVRQIGAHIFYGEPLNGSVNPGAQAKPRPKQVLPGLQFISLETIARNAREGGSRADTTPS